MHSALKTALLFSLFFSVIRADDATVCTKTYADLEEALLDRETDNNRLLRDAFYPPGGESLVHFLNVVYCVNSRLLLVIEPNLVRALTLTSVTFHIDEVLLIISPPFCSNVTLNNRQLLKTLTTWLKEYATGDRYNPEAIRGYVKHYEPGSEFSTSYYTKIDFPIGVLIPSALLTIVINVFLVLSFRVCSKKMAKRIDKALKIAANTVASGITAEKEKNETEQTPCLETIGSPSNSIFYILAIAVLTILDMSMFLTSTKYNIMNWLAFLPVPITATLCLFISVLIPSVIKCMTCAAMNTDNRHHLVNQIATVSLLTVLSVFVIFHGFWIAVVFTVYPTLVLSKALPLIPMYLPLLIIYRKIPYHLKKIHKFCQNRGSQGNKKHDGWIMIAGLCYAIFLCTVTWVPILGLIDYVSNELIVVAELGESPLQLILIVAVVSLITYRLAAVFVEVDQKNDKEQDIQFELSNDGLPQKNTSISLEEISSKARENISDKEIVLMPVEENDDDTVPIVK
uniref:G-protein coupled receptors family 1 profile domain-containing protein n=1 Tax=Amphimedon queenslandica TaxID=400682 RepID=A0A1X7TIP2_AMPQE